MEKKNFKFKFKCFSFFPYRRSCVYTRFDYYYYYYYYRGRDDRDDFRSNRCTLLSIHKGSLLSLHPLHFGFLSSLLLQRHKKHITMRVVIFHCQGNREDFFIFFLYFLFRRVFTFCCYSKK